MKTFPIHDVHTAPQSAVPLLTGAAQAYGFVPNLLAVLAEAPSALNAYMTGAQLFDQSSFSPTERQVVLLTVSRANRCAYCIAAHSVIAGMQQVPAGVVDAIRNDQVIEDARLEALRAFTQQVVDTRGWVQKQDIENFLAAGFTRAQIIEVIQGISLKTLSNLLNHIAETPLDTAFTAQQWYVPDSREAA